MTSGDLRNGALVTPMKKPNPSVGLVLKAEVII